LVGTSPTAFEFGESAGTLQFEKDDQGKVSEIMIRLDAAGVRRAKRVD